MLKIRQNTPDAGRGLQPDFDRRDSSVQAVPPGILSADPAENDEK
jgi:hypothetical protein